jgi:hypothetical protein
MSKMVSDALTTYLNSVCTSFRHLSTGLLSHKRLTDTEYPRGFCTGSEVHYRYSKDPERLDGR